VWDFLNRRKKKKSSNFLEFSRNWIERIVMNQWPFRHSLPDLCMHVTLITSASHSKPNKRPHSSFCHLLATNKFQKFAGLVVGLRFAPADNIYPTLPRTLHHIGNNKISRKFNQNLSRGIVRVSYILYGQTSLIWTATYVNSLKYRDAHTFPPCRKVY
jgi:hypothetical protein